MMNTDTVCEHFGLLNLHSISPLTAGLINSSYKVSLHHAPSVLLQRINTSLFREPAALQTNYLQIQQHLASTGGMALPALIPTTSGELLYEHKNEAWRCFQFLDNTYSPDAVHTPEKAYEVANCFGTFTAALQSFKSSNLATILPRFHDLHLRYQQLQEAMSNAVFEKKTSVKSLIQKIEDYSYLVAWFQKVNTHTTLFPLHILHHDCKISNILFDCSTDAIRCPVDIDTTQPGLFYSDIGDMIRTMASVSHENDTDIEYMAVRPDFVKAIMEGYLDAMSAYLTAEERKQIYLSGSIMVYMQALRFLTDYLNGNIYYKTSYSEQNKDRAANQLMLLDLLQPHLAQFQ